MPEPRQIKRPRLSLSCIVCRRRKVRCGRELPECANCVRMKQKCVYNTTVRDEATGKVPVPPQDRDSNQIDDSSHPSQQADSTWFHWVAQENTTDPSEALRERVVQTGSGDSNPLSVNPSLTRSAEHRQSVDDVYQKVLSGEQTDQVSGDQNAPAPKRNGGTSRAQDCSAVASIPPTSPDAGASLCCDYLSLRQGARARYIGRSFWGFVAGKESLGDDFFDENYHASPNLPLPHIASLEMFDLLRSLPTKPVSDALLEAFFSAVWPVSPLVHTPTLQADYDEFWDWCRNCGNAMPSDKIRDDPTFICLLFAVLYCGASAAPAASWTCTNLQGVQRESIVNQVRSAYTTSMSLCQHLEHPTLNTLISTLLTGPFLDQLHEPMRNLVSISTTVRLAQSMGLHREGAWSALSSVDREIRRRVWWHIVWLDVQSSISTGLPPCCGSEELEAVSMVADTRAESVALEQSVAMGLAIQRFQTARLQSKVVTRLQSGQGLTQAAFGDLVIAAKQLHLNIDTLIARIPEKGITSSSLANVSSTNTASYKHDEHHPAFAAWARIMLILLKSEMTILLQKPFLMPPDSTNSQSRKSWTSIAKVCVNYLRNFLQVYQDPVFSSYLWFCSNIYGPLQCVYLTLLYLHHFRGSEQVVHARQYVDEFIKHTVSRYEASCPDHEIPSKAARMPLALKVLVDLHSGLDSSIEPQSQQPQPLEAMEGQVYSAPYLANDSSFDMDLLNSILDLEA